MHVDQKVAGAADDDHDGDRPQKQYRHDTLSNSCLLFGADLGRLDGGLGLNLRLVNAIAHDRGCGRRRLGLDHGALLGGCITHDVELSGAGLGGESKGSESAAYEQLLHGVLLLKDHW